MMTMMKMYLIKFAKFNTMRYILLLLLFMILIMKLMDKPFKELRKCGFNNNFIIKM